MSSRDREKLKKAKARKKKAQAAKAARDGTAEVEAPREKITNAKTSPFGVDSVGRSIGSGAPRMPRRSKKG